MSKHNAKKTPEVAAPSMSLQLTEVVADAGMTPEQLAVAQSLAGFGGGLLVDQKKERHPDRLKVSKISSPVAMVYAIADAMVAVNPAVQRKEILDACVNNGIATLTARTQYQLWKKARTSAPGDAAAHVARQVAKPELDLGAFVASLGKTG